MARSPPTSRSPPPSSPSPRSPAARRCSPKGIHSAVDTGNGILLLVGTRLAERPATPEHPFGHGKQLYFWSLIGSGDVHGAGEDATALAGLAVASIGIFLSHRFDLPGADGAASLVIGGILAGVAVLLIRDPRASAADIGAAIKELEAVIRERGAAIKELEAVIRERFDKITRIYIEAVPTVR